MIKESLFAAEEREAKLDKLGDILQVLEKHVAFKALPLAVDQAAQGLSNFFHCLYLQPIITAER